MATKKKRSLRGLGRGLDVHSSAANNNFKHAKLYYSDVAKHAFSSKCAKAFSAIVAASEILGEAKAHDQESISMQPLATRSDGSPFRATTMMARSEAMKDFKTRCLVGKGLDGLSGRRRRK